MTTAIVQPAAGGGNGHPVPPNPAVARCVEASERAYQAMRTKRQSEYRAECAANKAFRGAMPPLSSPFRRCNQSPMDLGSVRYVPGSICQGCDRSVPHGPLYPHPSPLFLPSQ